MLRNELIENGERVLHYSDEGYYIEQVETGKRFEEAVDVLPCMYTYEETDEMIPEDPASAEEILAIMLGVEVEDLASGNPAFQDELALQEEIEEDADIDIQEGSE